MIRWYLFLTLCFQPGHHLTHPNAASCTTVAFPGPPFETEEECTKRGHAARALRQMNEYVIDQFCLPR